ncbi:protein sym-1-like [Actinia tenebrosa]|uniref:Protein sym-1-like n=1 Tax=Actinia tenebrosa TaxID=6105 RepID=A0A6P8IZJ9_ACTTE|nr:protein sym-1-like [Actinia tenebrosa]
MACVSYGAKPIQILFPFASGLRTNIKCRHLSLRKTYRHYCSKNGTNFSPQKNTSSSVARWSPWRWYNATLKRRPLITKCVTSGVLYGLGDVVAQKIWSPETKLDRQRILRGIVYGTIIAAPLGHLHFNFLEWLVVKKVAVRLALVPFVKVFIDQFVYWAPTLVFLYHVSMGIMEGLSYDQCIKKLKELYWPTLQANWMMWFPLQILNFKFIPVAHQLNFCLVVGMFWSTLLSYIRGKGTSREEETGGTVYEEMEVDVR